VDEHGINAHGKHVDAKFLEHGVFFRNCGKLGSSDKGEIPWIKTEERPFAEIF